MSAPVCVQCGQPLAEGARFCGHCGATQPALPAQTLMAGGAATPAPPPAAALALQATVLGTRSPLASAPPAEPPAPAGLPKQTMIGFASPLAAPPPAAPAPPPAAHKTMLGMPSPLAAAPSGTPAAPTTAVPHKTMLGMPSAAPRMPGPAPVPAGPPGGPPPMASLPEPAPALPPKRAPALTLPLQVKIPLPPAPLEELRAPPKPVVVKKGGVPLATVALIVGGVLVLGGVAVALLWKGSPPITAQARATPDGKDALHLACDPKACPDGTTAALGANRTTFAAGQADLPLAAPLHLGDNEFALEVVRSGESRPETAKFVVPVAYRVWADVTTMSAPRPSITVRAEAKPGTDISVDGKPVALDANGAGAYAVDESATTDGPADESKVVSLDLKYVVTPKGGAAESGTVSARVAVAPLRVDAPGTKAIVDEDHVLIAGRGPKGATVTIDGAPVTVGPDGAFETTLALPAVGDRSIEARGSTPALMPRTVHVGVSRVASLADAARAFEQQGPLGYDAVMSDLAGKTGQPIVVDGDVLEARASGHRTLVLVDDKRGCKRSPCLARVVVGRDLALARGEPLKAYGLVARGFTAPNGQTVPEVESQFLVRTKR